MTEYQLLIKKLVNKHISLEEKNKLQLWIQEDDANKIFFTNTLKELESEKRVIFNADIAYTKFIQSTTKEQPKTFKLPPLYKYAAILVLAIMIGYGIINNSKEDITTKVVDTKINIDTVDNDAITITLADGTTKAITSETVDVLKDSKGQAIAKKGSNGLVFDNDVDNGTLVYNEIFVPNSKTFKLELSDGTIVWLNSGTRFKFPQNFKYTTDKRTVYLTGEAFFDVTTNKSKPFIVNSNDIQIEVLGTQFNVSSYENEKNIATTLVEGSVNVFKNEMHNMAIHLSPGFQASFNRNDGNLSKRKVDTRIYTSWIDNKLIINNLKFSEILFKLERKYDVTIINKAQNMDNAIYKGEFGEESIEAILKTIALSTPFKYEINNKTIIIHN